MGVVKVETPVLVFVKKLVLHFCGNSTASVYKIPYFTVMLPVSGVVVYGYSVYACNVVSHGFVAGIVMQIFQNDFFVFFCHIPHKMK